MDPLTDPTGAIAVYKHQDKLFAFQSTCSQCKHPFTKSKLIDGKEGSGEVRLKCSFCAAEFALTKRGEQMPPIEDDKSFNPFGKIVGSMIKDRKPKPVKVYQLAADKEGFVNVKL